MAKISTPNEPTAEQAAEKAATEDYWRNFYGTK